VTSGSNDGPRSVSIPTRGTALYFFVRWVASVRRRQVSVLPSDLRDFESITTDVGDVSLHLVRGGTGPTLLLVHGFPQDWYEWRAVLPRLAVEAGEVVPGEASE
jgi:hypothetical protein